MVARLGGGVLRRRKAFREPRKKIYAVCEGKNTEPGYIRSLISEFRQQSIDIHIIPKGGDPSAVVARAAEIRNTLKKSRDPADKDSEVWVFFDVDEHPRFREACD